MHIHMYTQDLVYSHTRTSSDYNRTHSLMHVYISILDSGQLYMYMSVLSAKHYLYNKQIVGAVHMNYNFSTR